MPESSILDTALAAHTAGLCVVRAATDGSKAPLGRWKHRQYERPAHDDVIAEFKDWPNVGIVCGAVSDRVICLEFEGRFMERLDEVATALEDTGLFPVFKSWIDGYSEQTPSGGWHILIHYGGDGPVPGNTKIALDSERETLIETRGEGGFVIVAPSGGSTHPTGKAWVLASGNFENIAWVQPDEYEAILYCLGRFDETPPSPAPTPSRPRLTVVGDGWIHAALACYDPIETVLERWGWQYLRDDGRGQLWKRPGKTDPGHSARVNEAGRLIVFSSATPFEGPPRSYDAVDVDVIHSLGRTPGRDELLDERTAMLRRRRPTGASSAPATEVPVVETPDLSVWLPDSFWAARPWLTQLYEQSAPRLLGPEGVLGAYLSAYATTIPMSIRLPGDIVAQSPLNLYCCLVASSGGGKTGSMTTALDMLGYVNGPHQNVMLGVGLRSGEGLITAATVSKPKDDEPSYRQGVQVHFDEVGVLSRQSERMGSTTIPYLNTAWSGAGVVGGQKAADSGSFPASQVRVCAVIGVQYGAAANLFTGEAARLGFPQRLLFFGTDNPIIGEQRRRKLDPITVLAPTFWQHGEFTRTGGHDLRVPDEVLDEVFAWTQGRKLGQLHDPLDGHAMLLRLRVAGVFALADGRGWIETEDWNLAGMVLAHSTAIRSKLVAALGDVHTERAQAAGRLAEVSRSAGRAVWLEGKVQRILRRLTESEDGMTRKEIKSLLNSGERPDVDEILEHGVATGRIVHRHDRYHGGGR